MKKITFFLLVLKVNDFSISVIFLLLFFEKFCMMLFIHRFIKGLMKPMTIEDVSNISNEDLDFHIAALEGLEYKSDYSPTQQWEIGNRIIQRENIIIKKDHVSQLYCIPVFEYNNEVWGILKSSEYLRTAMLYFFAKRSGIISEQY